MENDVLIPGIFAGAGLLASVIIPGPLVAEGRRPETREAIGLRIMWDRVLDHIGDNNGGGQAPKP